MVLSHDKLRSVKKIIKAPDAKRSFDWKEGPMTAREFMQFFGTDVCRKMFEPVWAKACINKIKREQSELAIIADVIISFFKLAIFINVFSNAAYSSAVLYSVEDARHCATIFPT